MRLLHLSDLHLGFRQYQRQTPLGINQREADVAGVFRAAIDKAIALKPDVVLIGGDVFHNVRPSNPAILHAFAQFSRLTRAVPEALIVMVAGNHDKPRASETGCILRLFAQLGIVVVDDEPQRLSFAERDLSILAVPFSTGDKIAFDPDPEFRHNVLLVHGEVIGVAPAYATPERIALEISPDAIGYARWSYVAFGHYHVFRELAPNAFYSGSIEYTSANPWGDRQEERAARVAGKGMVEFDLSTGRRVFHQLKSARALIDLPVINARGMSASDLDTIIHANVGAIPGGIDDKIVRQVAQDVPRHIARELDHKTLREYKRRALHYHLDTRRPELLRHSGSGAPGRRPSLAETVRDKLLGRPLPADFDRQALVDLGLQYLRDADSADLLVAAPESE